VWRNLAFWTNDFRQQEQRVCSLRGWLRSRLVYSAIDAWFHEALRADWKSPADANASIVGPDRVVFNIEGNDYRLVVAIKYRHRIVFNDQCRICFLWKVRDAYDV
jgi:mRNA interferase HigB